MKSTERPQPRDSIRSTRYYNSTNDMRYINPRFTYLLTYLHTPIYRQHKIQHHLYRTDIRYNCQVLLHIG